MNLDLIEAIALGHDVGHTPFSHSGELVFDRLLPGGFDHQSHSIRVLSYLERRSDGQGLNLTVETLDGIFKHRGWRRPAGRIKPLKDRLYAFPIKLLMCSTTLTTVSAPVYCGRRKSPGAL